MIAMTVELKRTDSPFYWTLIVKTVFGEVIYSWDPTSDQNIDAWIAQCITSCMRRIPEQTQDNFMRWVSIAS